MLPTVPLHALPGHYGRDPGELSWGTVLASVHALAAETHAGFRDLDDRLGRLDGTIDQLGAETTAHFDAIDARFNSVDEQFAELKDLIIGMRDR